MVSQAYKELHQYYPQPGWVEHDPDEIWHSTLKVISQALASGKIPANQIAAIGITNQRETAILWDRRTGRPLHRAIVWQDRRTSDLCRKLKSREPEVRRTTGLVVDPYFSGTKIAWLLKYSSKVRQAVKRGNGAFGTPDSWLLWKLTGGKVHATDFTNASRTLLLDLRTLKWSKPMLRLFGVPGNILPRAMPSSGRFGVTAKVGPLPAGIPITGIAGDQQAALFGQGCVRPGQAKNTYGTGCFLLMQTGRKIIHSRNGLITTVACDAQGKPAYALEGSVFIAGAAIQWLRDGLKILSNAAESEALARSVPDAGGVYLVPAFVGLGAPYWKPEARGLICGLTRGTTRAHIARAALESIAFQSQELVHAMEQDSGTRLTKLQVDGGAVKNGLLLQMQADLAGVPVIRPKNVETTAMGAAQLAGIGCGLWNEKDLAGMRRVDRLFRPKWNSSRRAAALKEWRQAVRRAL